MNVFQESLMAGYTKYAETFDKWCKKAYPLLGEIRQCGIIELNSKGHALIATNKPEIGEQNLENKWFEHESIWTFVENFDNNDISLHTTQFGCDEELAIYKDEYKCSWFSHREIIDNDTQQVCFFSADTPAIYACLTQNLPIVKKFIYYFKNSNEEILEHYRQNKFDLGSASSNYFVRHKNQITERDKINYLLQTVGVLELGSTISYREWQCIKLLEAGKSAQETGEVLGISRRTVETFWVSIKKKLKAQKKSEVLSIIF
jgi:DNA-binding CsgD family transcriptional regulator